MVIERHHPDQVAKGHQPGDTTLENNEAHSGEGNSEEIIRHEEPNVFQLQLEKAQDSKASIPTPSLQVMIM